jgi:hypothetical protein
LAVTSLPSSYPEIGKAFFKIKIWASMCAGYEKTAQRLCHQL